MATLKDIAKEANVSVMTVSNVIHNRTDKVSQETIDKVQSIIKKHNYTPNMYARSLVNRKSKLVAIIFFHTTETNEGTFRDPFNTEILAGIEEVIKKQEFHLLVQSVHSVEEIELIVSKWNVDSVVIIGMLPDKVSLLEQKITKPVVIIDTYYDSKKEHVFFVNSDDEQGAKLATQHLIENQHKKIGFVSYGGLDAGGVVEKRYKSYVDTMKKNQLMVNEQTVFSYDSQTENIESFCDRLLQLKSEYTALVFAADLIALEVMQTFFDRGVVIPEDVSIVGFDDIYASKLVRPKLTTIRQDIQLKGHQVAHIIIDLLNKKKPQKVCTLPVYLVKRQSTRKI